MKSIQTRLTVTILAIFLAALGALGGNYWKARDIITSTITASMDEIGGASDVGDWLESRKAEITMMSVAPAVQSGNPEAILPFLVNAAKQNKAYDSMEAAGKIADLIGKIQGDTDQAVVAMNDGTREVKTGAAAVDAAGTAFREIAGLVAQVSGQVREISAAAEQQLASMEEIASSSQALPSSPRTSRTPSPRSACSPLRTDQRAGR